MEDEFGEFLQKRVRNLQKRMRRLEQYEETVAKEPGSLNEDQLAALAKKDEVEVPLKVQQGLLETYMEIQGKTTKSFSEKEIEAAEERGAAREREKLDITLKFLNRVATLHEQGSSSATPSLELGALAALLQQLYTGDDRAHVAVDKLHAGNATDKINGLSFQRIKALANGTAEPLPSDIKFGQNGASQASASTSASSASNLTANGNTNGTAANGNPNGNGSSKKTKRRTRKSNGNNNSKLQ